VETEEKVSRDFSTRQRRKEEAMCMGISCVAVKTPDEVIAKWGDRAVTDESRDSHSSIRGLHKIPESNGGPAASRCASVECWPTTDLADAETYRIVPDEPTAPPSWWDDEAIASIRKQLHAEVARRMELVKREGFWPGSLKLDVKFKGKMSVVKIGGNADFGGWTGSAPVLESIGGSAYFRGWTGSAPVLESIGGTAYFRGWTGSAPVLESIGGDAYFGFWTGSAPVLESIGGNADFGGWTGSAPVLASIGGSADFRGWTGSAPVLASIGGYAEIGGWTGSAKKLEKINGKEVTQKEIAAMKK
jgi:hypothetical protein